MVVWDPPLPLEGAARRRPSIRRPHRTCEHRLGAVVDPAVSAEAPWIPRPRVVGLLQENHPWREARDAGPVFAAPTGCDCRTALPPLSAGPSGQPLTRHHGAPRLLAPPLFGFGCLRRGGLGFGRRQRLRRRSPPEPSTLAAANPAASTGAGILDPRSARTAHLPLHWFCSLRDCGKLQICAILQPWSP